MKGRYFIPILAIVACSGPTRDPTDSDAASVSDAESDASPDLADLVEDPESDRAEDPTANTDFDGDAQADAGEGPDWGLDTIEDPDPMDIGVYPDARDADLHDPDDADLVEGPDLADSDDSDSDDAADGEETGSADVVDELDAEDDPATDPDVAPPLCAPPSSPGIPLLDDPPDQTFVERTTEVGIDGTQWMADETFADSPCGEASILAGGAAAADYDDDGDIDLFYARLGLPDRLFRNNGDGTFEDVALALGVDSARTSNGAAWADVDGDGDLDLFVATLASGSNHLYIQTETGLFVDEAEERGVAFSEPDDRPRDCGYVFDGAFGDIDQDGDLDFYLSRWIPSGRIWGSLIFENVGDGVFERRNEEWGPNPIARSVIFGASIFDFDGDNRIELLLTADFGTSTYWDWNGEVFTENTDPAGLGTDENGMGTTVGDIDGDGDLDVFVTAIYGETREECTVSWGCTGNRLYINDGRGRFEECTSEYGVRDGGWGWGTSMFDADNDGDLDIGMTGGYWLHWDVASLEGLRARLGRYRFGGMRLWRNDGVLPFVGTADSLSLVNTRRGRAFVPFDADRDGDIDLFVVNNSDEPAFFENRGMESRHWLVVSLRDSRSPNTRGIGAIVWVRPTPEGRWIRRDIAASGAFLSTPVPEAHFGLGDLEGAVEVRVRWPDGEITEISEVGLDIQLLIER